MQKRVVITGLGCYSPVGNDPQTAWENILAGKSGVGPITHYDTTDYRVKFGAEVKDFDPQSLFGVREARRMDRFTQFAVASACQAVSDAGMDLGDNNSGRDRIGVIVGTGIGGMGTQLEQARVFYDRGPNKVSPFMVPMILPDAASSMIAIHLGVRGPNMAIVTACASGTNAIGEAMNIIRRGQADAMFAGGSDAVIITMSMAGLGNMTALSTRNDDPLHASRPFDLYRDGFVMGEGAAILVLKSLDFALARGANILAELSGYGHSNDAFHISAPSEDGYGAKICMQAALKDAGLDPQQINYINAHGTSTPLNDKTETLAIKNVFGETAYQIPVSSTKSMTGHLLGATGALEAIFCVKAIRDSHVPATINYEFPDPECDLDYVPNVSRAASLSHVMSNSFGFGGHNASIVISKYNPTERLGAA